MNKAHMDKRLNQLPTWLWTNSTTLPPVYKMVWEAVREDKVRSNGMQTELLVDTNKVFPLLLTSQLPTEVLGHIWNLANQKYAGQLTEQELYIVLALVAAAQASYTFNSLDILHLLPFPPTPYLNIECLMNLQPVTQLNSPAKFQSLNDNAELNFIGPDGRYLSDVKGKTKLHQHGIISSDSNVQTTNSVPGKISSSDGKFHMTSTTVWDVNNILKETKQATNRIQIDSKHSSATDSCDDFSEFQSAPIPNIPSVPIWDTKQGSAIGSRLANHNLGVKKPVEKSKKNNINVKSVHGSVHVKITATPLNTSQNKDQPTLDCLPDLFPKCTIKNQSKTVILKDTVIRNNDPPKDHSETVKDRISSEIINLNSQKDVSNKIEWSEKVSSGILQFNQQDLMNNQLVEDKYSALRALVQDAIVSKESELNASHNSQSVDEFGEFISAEQPASNASVSNTLDTDNCTDIFTEFVLKSNNSNTNTTDLNVMPENSESFDNFKLEDIVVEERSLEMGKALQKEDAISINSIEFMNGAPNALTRSGSVPSLDLKSFLPSNTEDEQVVDTTHQSEYWEWKQYMESCVLLLQVAANIFTSITSELVLHEVLNSAQGYNFLCNLAEVAAVCRRVNFSYKEMDINIIGFDELLMDIDRIWAEMEPFYTNIPIVTELPAWPLHQGETICCSLCLTVITSGRVVYNENNYHVTCANLWLNCVNSHLPVMRHPSFYSHSNICPGNNHI
ncbi:PREDICTED: synergin gamma-like [Dufourea novaeangliae]|uniref:Synergin gamma n=1 Tax=Dufourea novaeangliae TaxID=178035 RepID=A0A154PPE9_DUFNO|nr:PREDICTED: synergin gamma-like [Dufourea novaeangliae]KZC13314.1 Synergin gamma [Dufourea novaeangliae]